MPLWSTTIAEMLTTLSTGLMERNFTARGSELNSAEDTAAMAEKMTSAMFADKEVTGQKNVPRAAVLEYRTGSAFIVEAKDTLPDSANASAPRRREEADLLIGTEGAPGAGAQARDIDLDTVEAAVLAANRPALEETCLKVLGGA